MTFDPDAYLAQDQSFDPDAYLGLATTEEKPAAEPANQPQESNLPQDVFNAVSEFAASANRSVTEFIDFVGPDTINIISHAVGSDFRVPTLTGVMAGENAIPFADKKVDTGIKGGFMEKGIARDVVQAAGAVVPSALAIKGVTGRDLTKAKGAVEEFLGFGSARNPTAVVGQKLVQQGGDAGIPVLTSDVRQPKTFPGKMIQQTAEKIPLAGTAPVRQGQQQMRQEAVERVANKYGEYSYDAIVNSLKEQKNKIKTAAGQTLERTGVKLDEIGDAPAVQAKQVIRQVQDELSKPNVIKGADVDRDLIELIGALDKPQTFTSLKENRTAFREISEKVDQTGRSQLPTRIKGLFTKIEKALGQDMDYFAKTNLSEGEYRQWKKANAAYADQAKILTKTRLKNVLDKGDYTPEAARNLLFSNSESEQRLLYKSLTNKGRQHARAAVISKVIDDASKMKAGVTPNSFVNKLKKYQSQIDVFFKGGDKAQLKGLMEVLDATQRAQDASVATPTGQQLIGLLSGAGLVVNPEATIAAAGTVGGLARLYESAPVRNALLKLGSTPKNSKSYGEHLLAAHVAILAAARSESDPAQDTQ